MGFNLTQELKKKKWDYFPLPSWKGYGFKTNERRRQWCSAGWATYQRTLFLTVFINFYILTISLWICFPISVDSFLYRSSILITHNKVSISFHHVYIPYSLNTHLLGVCIYVFLHYTHVSLRCYRFYTLSHNRIN